LPHAVAPVGAPSVLSCGGAKERGRFDGDAAATDAHAVTPVEAQSAAAGGGFTVSGKVIKKSCCCAELRRLRKDQVTRRDSAARRPTFGNWRLAAEQGFKLVIARMSFKTERLSTKTLSSFTRASSK
jgi:hypothetical protein